MREYGLGTARTGRGLSRDWKHCSEWSAVIIRRTEYANIFGEEPQRSVLVVVSLWSGRVVEWSGEYTGQWPASVLRGHLTVAVEM